MIDPILAARAIAYASTKNISLDVAKKLGSGQDGCVFRSSRKTAVKAFERLENFRNESESYRRLAHAGIYKLGRFAVPSLIGFSEPQMVVEMSIVSPPYLIDFGKVHIDRRPDYPDETWDEWQTKCVETFGDR